MSITFLLLSLLCLGVTTSHELENKASDLSNFYADAFTGMLRNAIVYKKKLYLRKMISANFLFSGCTKNYHREELITMLTEHSDATIDFKPYSAHFSSGERYIKYAMTVSGLGVAIEGNFVLEAIDGQWVLIEGRVPWCPRPHHFVAIPASDGSEVITKVFIDSLSRLIIAKDQVKLSALFLDKFLFHGCKGDYNKSEPRDLNLGTHKLPGKVLALLFSATSNFSITFQSSQWVSANADIQFSVLIRGFGLDPFEAQFILHHDNGSYALLGGKVSKCVSK